MADSEFLIDTTLDTSEAETSAEKLNEKIKNMTKSIEKMNEKEKIAFQNSANAFNKSAMAVENQKAKVQKLTSTLEEMKNMKVETQEFSDISKQIESAQTRLDKLTEAQELFIENGGKKRSSTYKKRQSEIEQLEQTIKHAKAEQQDLIDNGGAYTQVDTSKIESQIESAKIKLAELQNELYGKGVKLKLILDNAKSERGISSFFKKQFENVKSLADHTGAAIKKSFSNAFKGLGGIANIGLNGLKKSFQKITKIFKNPKELSKPFDLGAKKLMKYGLGVRSVFALINKLRNALMQGVSNLTNFNNGNNEMNKTLTSLKSSLTQLKNSFATAFAPIAQMVAPAITNMINLLNMLITKLGMVMATLSGAKSFTKAKAVVDKYADSVGKASNKLAAFDELNTLDSGDNGLSANDMFETVPIEDSAVSIADKIKESWNDADFTDLGTSVGNKIMNALDKIDWSRLKETARKAGTSLATFINGMISTEGLGSSLGRNLGEAINTAINGVHDFLSNVNFEGIGTFIGNAINGALYTIDFGKLGETLGMKVQGTFDLVFGTLKTIDYGQLLKDVFETILGFLSKIDVSKIINDLGKVITKIFEGIADFFQSYDWMQLGQDLYENIKTTVTEIDWGGVADSLFEALGSALGGLFSFLWGIISSAWNDLVTWWKDTAYEDGEFTMQGLLDGIWEKICNIGTWIYEHIFQPFVDGFKKAFDINSPSKEMSKMGSFIIDGLFNGINDNIQKVVEIWENFKATVVGIFDSLWGGIKNVINSILGGIETMANGVVRGINKVIESLNGLQFEMPDWLGGKTFGFNIGTLSEVQLPRLATGTVVPRQASEFMAIMGDNNTETEVVSPLSTIKQALSEVMSEYGRGNGDVYISAEGDLDALVRLLKLKIDNENNRVGRSFEKVSTVW